MSDVWSICGLVYGFSDISIKMWFYQTNEEKWAANVREKIDEKDKQKTAFK